MGSSGRHDAFTVKLSLISIEIGDPQRRHWAVAGAPKVGNWWSRSEISNGRRTEGRSDPSSSTLIILKPTGCVGSRAESKRSARSWGCGRGGLSGGWRRRDAPNCGSVARSTLFCCPDRRKKWSYSCAEVVSCALRGGYAFSQASFASTKAWRNSAICCA